MSLRAVLVESNREERELVANLIGDLGHSVAAYADFSFCPVFAGDAAHCPYPAPCCSLQIISNRPLAGLSGLDFISWQQRRGCRLSPEKSAVTSDCWTGTEQAAGHKLGVRLFTKPFLVRDLVDWIYRIRLTS